MKTSRLKDFANRAAGNTAYEIYQDLCNELDYRSKNGIFKLFDDATENGCNNEQSAEFVFQAIENFKKKNYSKNMWISNVRTCEIVRSKLTFSNLFRKIEYLVDELISELTKENKF